MISNEHISDLRLAHKYRKSLATSPQQSSFRVVALFFLESPDDDEDGGSGEEAKKWDALPIATRWEGGRPYIVGTNTESCWVGNSICAERAALTQLRWIPDAVVTKIVIVTDAPHAVAPGMLCREFMSSQPQISLDVPIVLGGTTCCPDPDNENDIDPMSDGYDYVESISTLKQLYPFPSLFMRKSLQDCLMMGAKWKDACMSSETHLMKLARLAAERDDSVELHPISYGAAVLFRDKSYATANQVKGLEYGCSLDAVCQLASILRLKRSKGILPLQLVQVDQFGIAHAPFAPARSFLLEQGYGDVQVLIHTWNNATEGIQWHTVRAHDLAPKAPYLGVLHLNDMT